MKEDYLISIIGRQKVDGESGEVRLTTRGSYTVKGNSRYIVYQEYDEDSQLSPQTSILKVEDQENRVTLIRGGMDGTRLILEKGKRHLCQYDTGYGSLVVGVFTSKLRSSLGEKGGRVDINYTLDINSDLSSINEISITVKEAEQKDVKDCTAGN